MQVFVEHPEVLVGSFDEPASALIEATAERFRDKKRKLSPLFPGASRYLACNLDEEERLFRVGASLRSFALSLHQSRLHRQKELVRDVGGGAPLSIINAFNPVLSLCGAEKVPLEALLCLTYHNFAPFSASLPSSNNPLGLLYWGREI